MLVYDLEIIKAIQGRNEPRYEQVEYCEGWGDHANMGISCLCAYDFDSGRYRVFTESNKTDFILLATQHDILVGFNNINFDNKVIAACWGYKINPDRCFDILRKIWKAAGHDENKFSPATHAGYGLNACAKANFDLNKTGYGGYAPIEWQQGKIGNVIDYCLEDVRLTFMLLRKIMLSGYINDPKYPGKALRI